MTQAQRKGNPFDVGRSEIDTMGLFQIERVRAKRRTRHALAERREGRVMSERLKIGKGKCGEFSTRQRKDVESMGFKEGGVDAG